jgi:hypothetical protein
MVTAKEDRGAAAVVDLAAASSEPCSGAHGGHGHAQPARSSGATKGIGRTAE